MTDDRSERLRKRRRESAKQAEQQHQSETTTDAETSSEQHQTDGDQADADENSGTTSSIKDNQVGTYMYLPETQTKDLRRVYNVLKAEYEFKFDTEFEKNRHFYPLVIQYGLDSLDGMDASAIREKLHELE
jgi:hypothetical protein